MAEDQDLCQQNEARSERTSQEEEEVSMVGKGYTSRICNDFSTREIQPSS